MRKMVIGTILLIGIVGAALWYERALLADYARTVSRPELPEAVSFEEAQGEKEKDGIEEIEEVEEIKEFEGIDVGQTEQEPDSNPSNPSAPSLPSSFNLAVPFTPQAPHADWSAPFKEACEEASVYMVHAFYEGRSEGLIDPDEAEEELRRIVAFQETLFGYYEDTDASETATFTERLYGYGRVEVVSHPTAEDLKRYLYEGMPVIVPAAGRELGNPYFQSPGPLYHMLVIRGWTEDGFITNDPGTRHGEGFVYPYDRLMAAMHDWNGGQVEEGVPMAIIIHPEE